MTFVAGRCGPRDKQRGGRAVKQAFLCAPCRFKVVFLKQPAQVVNFRKASLVDHVLNPGKHDFYEKQSEFLVYVVRTGFIKPDASGDFSLSETQKSLSKSLLLQ